MEDNWDIDASEYNVTQEDVSKANASRKLSKTDVDIALSNLPKVQDFQITKAVEEGVKPISDLISNTKSTNIIIPYAQLSRKHWVTLKVTKEENSKINIELIDSKGGASKRPEEEYSKNAIKRFGQKLMDKIGGLKDKLLSTVVGNIELNTIKKELQKNYHDTQISTKLTKLETQRDDIHCGRHMIANILSLSEGKQPEIDLEKANAKMNLINDLVAGKITENKIEKTTINTSNIEEKIEVNIEKTRIRSKSSPPSINSDKREINEKMDTSRPIDNNLEEIESQKSKLANHLAEAAQNEFLISGKPIESQADIYENKMKSVDNLVEAAKSELSKSEIPQKEITTKNQPDYNQSRVETNTNINSVNNELEKAEKEVTKNNAKNLSSDKSRLLPASLESFKAMISLNYTEHLPRNYSISPTPTPTLNSNSRNSFTRD